MLMQEHWLSVEEIAAHLGVKPDATYKCITHKKMPAHRVGRLWKFLGSEVDQWVKGGKAAQQISRKPSAAKNSKRANPQRHSKL